MIGRRDSQHPISEGYFEILLIDARQLCCHFNRVFNSRIRVDFRSKLGNEKLRELSAMFGSVRGYLQV